MVFGRLGDAIWYIVKHSFENSSMIDDPLPKLHLEEFYCKYRKYADCEKPGHRILFNNILQGMFNTWGFPDIGGVVQDTGGIPLVHRGIP